MAPLTDRILMGPGPSNPYPESVAALGRPMLGHLDPEFLALLDETCERLRTVFRTANPRTLPISGTGSAGMEAAFVNTVGPGDVVVVGINGVFGERMCDVASRCGAEVVRVEAPWGRALDPAALLAAHPSPKVIAVVHAETSTGVRNDVEPLGAGKGDALLLVDCVTSLGGIPVEIDGWGVDIAYSGTQKCLGVAPGLAPLTMNERAWSRRIERPQSWYLDLGMIGDYATTAGARKYHHTAPISMIFSLLAGLGALLDEGLEAAWERHASCGAALQDGLVKLGFELFAEEGHRLPELTTVRLPDAIAGDREPGVRRALLDEYGIEVGGGLGEYVGKVWRIGCMGHTARPRNVALLLAALADVLGR
ncbi:MAG: alanine-glyoxylate transaminase / serine-glyoxylate transaminase / serine-pyruvate transaminase [Actinomycetota bacterium]|jgi:alanine-glyoxylate transaminase/serine-glyoxylate transaminase/serine-pyruvate transaminase|nr:alanine-glyoxylate transaminase / serine-glyoxylate transaminase / serine-pyruvate transaminase [Actinomycetota bacterium]